MAAATLAAAAALTGAGGTASAFAVVGSETRPQGRTALRHSASGAPLGQPGQPVPQNLRGEAESTAWPQLAAVTGAFAAAASAVGRRRRIAAASKGAGSTQLGVLALGQQPVQAHLAAARGNAAASTTGRGARIVVKNGGKTKRGMYARFRRKDMWLNLSKNFKGRQRNVHRFARQAVMDALKKKYRSRRLFKRERRKLWIMRCNANAKLHGISYSYFIMKCKEANVNINRKILSQLGVYDRCVFTNIVDLACPNWQEIKAKKNYVSPGYSVEQIDDVMIPYIEKTVPEIYTDANIRFNRQVKEGRVEYTVDMGDPEMWREVLPKMPELANFNLPDHWMKNANAEHEMLPLSMITVPKGQESDDYMSFMYRVKKEQMLDKVREKEGEKTWPKKEGVTREDWFKEEPQSWFK